MAGELCTAYRKYNIQGGAGGNNEYRAVLGNKQPTLIVSIL